MYIGGVIIHAIYLDIRSIRLSKTTLDSFYLCICFILLAIKRTILDHREPYVSLLQYVYV